MGKIRIDTVSIEFSDPRTAFAFSNPHHLMGRDLEMPEFSHPPSRPQAGFTQPDDGGEREFTQPDDGGEREFTQPDDGGEPDFSHPVTKMPGAYAKQNGNSVTLTLKEPRRVASIKIERLKNGNAVVHLR